MDLASINSDVCAILDTHGVGRIKDLKPDRLYGEPSETRVYGDLLDYYSHNYTAVTGLLATDEGCLQLLVNDDETDPLAQINMSLLMGRTPVMQPPPLYRHDNSLKTIDTGDGAFTSILEVSDTFVQACAMLRPLLEQGRMLVLPRGFGWRLPLRNEDPALNALQYSAESLGRFQEGGLGALLDSFESAGAIQSFLLRPAFARLSAHVGQASWSSLVGSMTRADDGSTFCVALPESLNPVQLNDLMNEEPEAFLRCARALEGISRAAVAQTESGAEQQEEVARLYRDSVQPELASLEQLYSKYMKVHRIKLGATVVAAIPLVATALSLGGTVEVLSQAVGATGLLALAGKQYADYLADMAALKDSPWYFIWKLGKEASGGRI